MTRRVFAESVFAESVLLSQLFADAARIVVDRQFIDVNIDRGGCWGTAWRWVMIQSGNVLYTYTKRFVWVSVFDDKACFAESVFVFAESVFAESGAFLPSQFLLSQLFADEAR